MFFNELNEALYKTVNCCENMIVIGDLNIDVSDPDKIERTIYLASFTLSHYQI